MHRQKLLHLLKNYEPLDNHEDHMYKRTLQFVKTTPECFDNRHPVGHITASGWVIDPDTKMTCMVHHKIFNAWHQPGGHSDGNTDTPQEALREAREELGIESLQLQSDDIFDIDVHEIPDDTKRGLGKHFHFDIRFIVIGNSSIKPVSSDESHEAKWIPLDEVEQYNDDESIMRMVRKC